MDYEEFEKNIIHEYWKTLEVKNIGNIFNNQYLKKPYLEKYIIKLSTIIDDKAMLKKITNYQENNQITTEELIFIVNNNFDLSNQSKKKIELFILNDDDIEVLSSKLIFYQVKYFRFYQTVCELLFDLKKDSDDNELYNFIFIFIKNKKHEMKHYYNKNLKFQIFHNYINDLYEKYREIFSLATKQQLIEENYNKKEIYNLFLKNLFTNWYNIYKKDIIEQKIHEKTKDYTVKRNLLSSILCLPNL